MIGKDFIVAGSAIFTIDRMSRHYTYRVSRKDGGEHCAKCDGSGYWSNSLRPCYACKGTGKTKPVYFVGLLTGPDNESDYTYVGILDAENGRLVLTRKSKYTDNSNPVAWFRYVAANLWKDTEMESDWTVHHEGRCGRCGRTLTVPASIESGIGPVCAGKS